MEAASDPLDWVEVMPGVILVTSSAGLLSASATFELAGSVTVGKPNDGPRGLFQRDRRAMAAPVAPKMNTSTMIKAILCLRKRHFPATILH